MRCAVVVGLALALSACVGGADEHVGEAGEELVTIDPHILSEIALRDPRFDPAALRSWLSKNMPVWHLYNYGRRCEGRICGDVVLAIPADAPGEQSIQLDELSISRVGGEAFIRDLVARGRLSTLDLVALRAAFEGAPSIWTLPYATVALGQPKRGRCTECSEDPGISLPTSPDGAGMGGPTWVGAGERPSASGATSGAKGPGWRDPPPPVPESGPDKGLSFFGKIKDGLDRALDSFVWNKRECNYACLSAPTATLYAANVCRVPMLRAIPHTGVPCTALDGLAVATGIAAPWCQMWCDQIFEKEGRK